jgi:crotonobetainyl-CoA:carnitine CoA-transferase CaiB-like acyl-CoA transferase
MAGVLDGVRVLDFGRYIAGPYCACLLGDLGADVIRIERPEGGEDRDVIPLGEHDGGANFLPLNRNKRSLTLDPASQEGRKVVAALVKNADIVIANLPPQALVSMGLDYDTLRAIKPDIILTTLNAFGSGGPWSHRVGFDGIAQAMSGLVYMTGHPGDPQKAYGPWADFSAATFAAFGTLAALLYRRQTGVGQHVEAPLIKAALVPATALLAEQSVTNINRGPTANRSQTGAPADLFRTKDGWILVQIISQALFKRWTRMVDDESLFYDERFKDDAARVVHSEILSEIMAKWMAERTTEEALAALEKASLPGGPLLTPAQVLAHEHLRAIEAFKYLSYPGVPAPVPMLTLPVTLSATPGVIKSAAPLNGEHSDEILHEAGFSAAEILEFRAHKIV